VIFFGADEIEEEGKGKRRVAVEEEGSSLGFARA
jgi:hypothetical protein